MMAAICESQHQWRQALLLIVSGPAGSGKTTLCDRLCRQQDNVSRVVTTTTRSPREGEQDGVDYHFLSVEAFTKGIAEDAFYEYAEVHGRYYGTQRKDVDQALAAGHDLLLNIDVQGAAAFRRQAADYSSLAKSLVTVFIMPPSLEELRRRLVSRATDDEAEIERRLQTALGEIEQAGRYDFVLPSGTMDLDYSNLVAIYQAEKMRNLKA